MEKVILDWKAPSDRKMADFVGQFDDATKKEFAQACMIRKNGKPFVVKSKAKKWLVEKFDSTEQIEWKNRPQKAKTKTSGAEDIEGWLKL